MSVKWLWIRTVSRVSECQKITLISISVSTDYRIIQCWETWFKKNFTGFDIRIKWPLNHTVSKMKFQKNKHWSRHQRWWPKAEPDFCMSVPRLEAGLLCTVRWNCRWNRFRFGKWCIKYVYGCEMDGWILVCMIVGDPFYVFLIFKASL